VRKMRISKRVPQGVEVPRFYGIAYWDYWSDYGVCYPVPLNLMVRIGRWAWHESIRFRPTKLDKMMRKAYETGIAFGREQCSGS